MAKRPPMVLSMVLCDSVWQDPTTGKYFLLGLLEYVGADAFPAIYPGLTVFAELTDAQGEVEVMVELLQVLPSGNRTIRTDRGKVQFPDKTTTIGVSFSLADTTLPEAGEYWLELSAGGDHLAARRLVAWKTGRGS